MRNESDGALATQAIVTGVVGGVAIVGGGEALLGVGTLGGGAAAADAAAYAANAAEAESSAGWLGEQLTQMEEMGFDNSPLYQQMQTAWEQALQDVRFWRGALS